MYPMKLSKTIFTLLVVTLLILNSSCGIYKPVNTREVPVNAKDRVKKNIEEGRGIKLGRPNIGEGSFAEFNPLWKATLDTLDFMVLNNADYGGGIVITDWYSENNDDESIKITVRFLSNEIRADGLDVIIHRKICEVNKSCKTTKIEGNLNKEIKLAILRNAAIYEKKLSEKKLKAYRKKFPKRTIGDEVGD